VSGLVDQDVGYTSFPMHLTDGCGRVGGELRAEFSLNRRLKAPLTLPSQVLNCQLGSKVVQKEIVTTTVEDDLDLIGERAEESIGGRAGIVTKDVILAGAPGFTIRNVKALADFGIIKPGSFEIERRMLTRLRAITDIIDIEAGIDFLSDIVGSTVKKLTTEFAGGRWLGSKTRIPGL